MNIFLKIIYFLFYIQIFVNTNQIKDIVNDNNNVNEYNIRLQEVQIEYLFYNKTNKLFINKIDEMDLVFVNIYSVDCYIEIKVEDEDKNSIKLLNYTDNNCFSFNIINKTNASFKVNPLMDLINGNYKYNYENRYCPIIINSGKYGNDSKLEMNISEPTILYFNEHLNQYNISYKINNSDYENFVAFSFIFKEQSIFNIKVLNDEIKQNNYKTSFQFNNSTNIFFDNYYLNKINGNMNISINYNDNLNQSIFLILKPIQKECISILQKDNINKGFITSSTKYQYYYMKVFEGEEGEIMLHNKRTNGRLFGEIIRNNTIDIYNKNNYPIEESNLTFNEYTLKIKYNFSDTEDCQDGCYLLVTYYQENLQYINTVVGYEFTLLVRTWDDVDLSPQRINIPFNELIFGHFEEESISNHYYSIFIPNGIDEIILQIGGNFFEGFIGVGRKKLITTKTMKNITKLGITNDKMLIKFKLSELLNIDINSNKYISFAFRPKDYFINTLSFYFFRILYPKYDNNNLILPLDSNIGNICQPEKETKSEDQNGDIFYCYFSLYNLYNQFSLKYSLSISQQIKDINIAYSTFKNKTKLKDYSTQNFFCSEDNNDELDLIQFKFEFFDDQAKNILLAFEDGSNEIVPNIYSSQIYQINNVKKTLKFVKTDIFSLMYNWIYGNGYIDVTTTENKDLSILHSRNFKAKPLFIQLNEVNNIIFRSGNICIFYLKLKYIMKNKGVEELIYGEVINELIINKQFPLYYYIKITQNITNILFRELNYNLNETRKINYNIEAYSLEYKDIEKIMKGEYTQKSDNKFESYYDAISKISLLKINETNIYDKYILTKIDINNNNYVNSNDMIQLMTLYKNESEYILPINQYITGDFDFWKEENDNDNCNSYLVQISEIDKRDDEIIIELIPNYDEIKLEDIICDNEIIITNEILHTDNGIKKYRITKCNNSFRIKIKKIKNKLNQNYILRYYYSNPNRENIYTFSKIYKVYKIEEYSNDTVFIKFEFDKINITNNYSVKKCSFKIYSFLFIEENIINGEKIDTLAILSSKPSYEDEILIHEEEPKFNISFKNISRDNYNYVLQIKVHILINDTFFNEDYLVYSLPINLKKQLEKTNKKLYLILGLVGGVIILIITIFIISYIKIKHKNIELKEKVLSISFSSGISQDILNDEQHASKKDEEYETTFI